MKTFGMNPVMNYCQKCHKFSFRVLEYYRGKMICSSCKAALQEEEYKKEQERRNRK